MTRLSEWFGDVTSRHGIVGASIALLDDGAIDTACWGEARHGSGQAVTPDTVFQIGSITKLYTATMVMQLASAGQVGLDDSLGRLIPELRRVNAEIADSTSVRDLLTHTSGLDSNYVPDTGRGDDCLALLVDACGGLTRVGPAGTYSYCNVGFALLGRAIEVATGAPWDAALQQAILEPAGLRATMTLPESVLLHPAAVGHFPDVTADGTRWRLPDVWSVHRSAGPAGGICSTPHDVVSFIRAVMADGDSALLDDGLRREMTKAHVPVPDSDGDGCGLGWHIRTLSGRALVGHTGGNMGQGGQVWVDLERRQAVCILVNGLACDDYLDDITTTALAAG